MQGKDFKTYSPLLGWRIQCKEGDGGDRIFESIGPMGRWDRRATDKPVGAKESVGEE